MIEGNCRGKMAVPFLWQAMGACGHSAASASDTPRGTSGLWSQCPWGMADEACPPQGSGPIFTARRVWKSVCRNESTSFPGTFPVVAPSSGGCAATSCPRCGIRFPGPLGHGNRAAAWLCPCFIRRGGASGTAPQGEEWACFCLKQIQGAVQIDGLPDL